MDWIDLIGRAEFLRQLFPQAPSLQGLRLFEVNLHQDGPRVLLRFDLKAFPEHPPAKWVKEANRVQVRLLGVGVQSLQIQGWTANNIVDLEVEAASPKGRRFVARGAGFSLEAVFDSLELTGVSAYCSTEA